MKPIIKIAITLVLLIGSLGAKSQRLSTITVGSITMVEPTLNNLRTMYGMSLIEWERTVETMGYGHKAYHDGDVSYTKSSPHDVGNMARVTREPHAVCIGWTHLKYTNVILDNLVSEVESNYVGMDGDYAKYDVHVGKSVYRLSIYRDDKVESVVMEEIVRK